MSNQEHFNLNHWYDSYAKSKARFEARNNINDGNENFIVRLNDQSILMHQNSKIQTELKPHQKISLKWMMEIENNEPIQI